MTVPTYRLPPQIEAGARGGPEFKNIIQTAVSGKEKRLLRWARPRWKYDLSTPIFESDDPVGDFQAIREIHIAHFGSLFPFRFKDFLDYSVTDMWFGTGDGVETQFQLGRRYNPGLILEMSLGVRDLFRPVYAIVGVPVIKIDGSITSAYTLGDTGLVTFDSPVTDTKDVTWTGEFDVVVRFESDELLATMREGTLVKVDNINLIEVLGEA